MDTSDAQTRSAPQQSRDYKYLILYLTPDNIIEKDETLKKQWDAIQTIIPCLIKGLKEGTLEVRMDDFEKAISGLRNVENVHEHNILGRTAVLWYFLTKRFHQSIGPRKGNFMEELITSWVRKYRNNVKIERNIQLGNLLENYYGVNVGSRSMIDFAIIDNSTKSLHLIELRTNEATGGRSAQQSLLDKFDLVLRYLEDEKIKLRERFINRGTWNIYMDIAILFNQTTFELLNENNYNRGRFESLIGYIMDDRHIWGQLKNLRDYVICNNNRRITTDEGTKQTIKRELEENRGICIKRIIDNNEFKIYIRILFGDEFFEEYIGKSLRDLLGESHVADDVWLFYALTLNELKIAQEFGETHVKHIYDLLRNTDIFQKFHNLLYEDKNNDIETFLNKFNDLINECLSTIISKSVELRELRPLETNDVIKIVEYLKQVCIGLLALHVYERDRNKRQCNWEETTMITQ